MFQIVGECKENGITVKHYVHQLLKPHIVTLATHVKLAFQQDNSRLPVAWDTIDFLLQHNISTQLWPPLGVYLNLNENLQDALKPIAFWTDSGIQYDEDLWPFWSISWDTRYWTCHHLQPRCASSSHYWNTRQRSINFSQFVPKK